MHMPKSVGDRTPPRGTPFLNWHFVDVLLLNVVHALRHLMYLCVGCLFGVAYA